MHLTAMLMLNSTLLIIRDIMSYMNNTYTNLNQDFSSTAEAWGLFFSLVEKMFTIDFVPVKADMISADVVKDPRDCSGLVFWNNLKLVKVDS